MNELLLELREKLGIKQSDFAKSIGLSQSGYSLIENGKRELNDRICKLISIEYNVSEEWLKTGNGDMFIKQSPALNQFEQLIHDFSLEELRKMNEFMEMLIKVKEGSKVIQIRDYVETIARPLYDLPASAGNGHFLDGEHYEMVDFPANAVPPDSTFCVRIAGDSMEPEFHDHDIVFVKQMPMIESGQIGVFVLNGEGYIKQYFEDGENCSLVSLNPEYDPIVITECDSLKVVGKVVQI
jgi:repressor LexA